MGNGIKWDDDSLEMLEGADPEVKAKFTRGIKDRRAAKLLEDKATKLKKRANESLLDAFYTTGMTFKTLKAEGLGSITWKENTARETLDKVKLKETLLNLGVDIDVINKAFKKATKVTEPSELFSVAYRG